MKKKVLIIFGIFILIGLVGSVKADCIDGWTNGNISQYNITWFFDKPYQCGTFVNGDYWVLGPVNITNINPEIIFVNDTIIGNDGNTHICAHNVDCQCQNYTPSPYLGIYNYSYRLVSVTSDLWGDYICKYNVGRNGLTINPIGRAEQTFDSRDYGFRSDWFLTTPLLVAVNSSVISTISFPDQTECSRGYGGGWYNYLGVCSEHWLLKTAAVLTVLDVIPESGSFRPSYAGDDKALKFNLNDLYVSGKGFSLLKNLTPAFSNTYGGTSLPNINESARDFQRVWLNTRQGWTQQNIVPADNANSYGRDVSYDVGIAALLLNTNLTNEEKKELLINFLQVGIDHYGLIMNGMYWPADGGIASGRKFPILFAGLLLNDSRMKDISNLNLSCGADCFGEDSQTFYVDAVNINVSFKKPYSEIFVVYGEDSENPNIERYKFSQVGMPEWGIKHSATINYLGYDQNSWTDASTSGYKQCCNGKSWVGPILIAQMFNMRPLWNHNALFDFEDRYVEVNKQLYNATPGNNGYAGGYPGNMWEAYRFNIGCYWTRLNQTDSLSNGFYVCDNYNVSCTWQATECASCVKVSTCQQYPNLRALNYDPCGFGCKETSIVQTNCMITKAYWQIA